MKAADFVIVGAGFTRGTVARRLVDIGQFDVALFGAGQTDQSLWFKVPVGFYRTRFNPLYHWCFRTNPEEGIAYRGMVRPHHHDRKESSSQAVGGNFFVTGTHLSPPPCL
jgi:choline dehydrogenase